MAPSRKADLVRRLFARQENPEGPAGPAPPARGVPSVTLVQFLASVRPDLVGLGGGRESEESAGVTA